ncbi:hypothetical protein V8C86DRAFT_2447463, partial [Haematococcus lacustris]
WSCRRSNDYTYQLAAAAVDRLITVSTCVDNVAAWDTFLVAFPTQGSSCPTCPLAGAVFDDEGGPCGQRRSQLTITALAGRAYTVVVEGWAIRADRDDPVGQDPVVRCQDPEGQNPVVWCQDPVGQDPVVRCQDPVGQDPVVRCQDPVGQDPVVWCQDPVGQDPVVRCQDPVGQDPVDPVVRCQDPVVRCQDPVGQDPVVRCQDPVGQNPVVRCQDPVVRCQDPVGRDPVVRCQDPLGQDLEVWCQDPVVWCQDPVGQNPVVRCQDPVVRCQDPVVRCQDPVSQDPVVWCQDPVSARSCSNPQIIDVGTGSSVFVPNVSTCNTTSSQLCQNITTGADYTYQLAAAAFNRTITVTTCFTGAAAYDTVILAFATPGTSCPNCPLGRTSFDDNGGSCGQGRSQLTVTVPAGQTFTVVVENYPLGTGAFPGPAKCQCPFHCLMARVKRNG